MNFLQGFMKDKLELDLEELIKYTKADQKNKSSHVTGLYKLDIKRLPRDKSEKISFDYKTNYEKKYDNGVIEVEEIQKDRDKTFMPRPEGFRVHIKATKNGDVIYNQSFAWIRKAYYSEYDE